MMRTRRSLGLLLALAAVVVAACADTEGDATPSATDATVQASGDDEPDPRRDALVAALDDLRSSVEGARALLVEARDAGDAGTARRAVAALTADEDLTDGDRAETTPLLPGPETSRQATVDYGDAFTAALDAARDGGGTLAADASRVISDTIAGDLGAWQRDAAGVLEAVDEFATGRDVAAAEERVLDLPGEGARALAWALFASRADDPETVSAAAERGLAHLDLIRSAVAELTTPDT